MSSVETPIEEIIGWTAEVDLKNDRIVGWYDGEDFIPRAEVDDLLSWLRDNSAETWFGCHDEHPLTRTTYELCVFKPGHATYRPHGHASLRGALVEAVREVSRHA